MIKLLTKIGEGTVFKATLIGIVIASMAMMSLVLNNDQSFAQQQALSIQQPSKSDTAQFVVSGKETVKKVYLFNDNKEIGCSGSGCPIGVAGLQYSFSNPAGSHRLIVQFSAVGSVVPDRAATAGFIGCFIDNIRNPCIGSQTEPTFLPGWVNTLSCNFPSSCAWDNTVGYTWWTGQLSNGTHTVIIGATTGDILTSSFGSGSFNVEARNLIVTVVAP